MIQFKDVNISYKLFGLRDPNVCQKKRVVVFVESAPDHAEARSNIRMSWGNLSVSFFITLDIQRAYDLAYSRIISRSFYCWISDKLRHRKRFTIGI
jgi:hypothetical protein